MKATYIVGLGVVLCAGHAHADDATTHVSGSVSAPRRAGALAASVVPGVLVHGSGHWVMGDKKTARRLRKMELVGLLLAGAGGAAAGLSGMDENLALLYVPLLVAGGTTFAGSFLSDVIGVAAHGTTVAGEATRPGWGTGGLGHTSLGYRFVHHPGIAVRHVARADAGFDEVGRTQQGAQRVHVDPGNVLDHDATRVSVRASAPVTHIELSGAGTIEVRVENVTADAEVSGAGIESVSAPSALARVIRVSLPTTLTIGPPDVDTHRTIRFAFVSDFQVNADAGEAIVREINADPDIEMVLCTGDIIDKGSDSEQWAVMEPVLAKLRVPLYATTGNHELNGDSGVQYHRRLGRMNYAFDYHGTRFALADSGSATLAPRVFDFLDESLSQDGAALRVFMTHIPLLDSSGIRNGGFSSRLEAQRILAMLSRNRVDLTLYGHVHSFEVFSNARIPAFISGGGGGNDNAFDGIGNHFLLVTMDPVARRADAVVRVARPE